MALPITSTPILKDEDAERFWEEIEENESKPKEMLVYPNISKAIELIRKNA